MSTLPLKPVVDVYYNLGPISAVRKGFNLGAILGSSTVIPSATRGIVYNSVDEMLEQGFANGSPEVLAAQVYFAATSGPDQLYVGRWVEESTKAQRYYMGPISNGNIVNINGTSYTVGDGSSDTATLDTITGAATTAGAIQATHTQNTLYILFEADSAGSGQDPKALSVTKGTGSDVGQVMNIAGEDAETLLEAVQACRASNTDWYAMALTSVASDDDIKAIAAYIESTEQSQPSTYFAHTDEEAVFSNSEGNLFSILKGMNYSRTIGTASSQPYTHVGAMGYAMGQTRDTAGSTYTLGLKQIPGTLVDNLTSTEVTNVESNNGNVYINRGAYYDMYEKGKVFSGAWYDEIIQLDKLVNRVQLNVMDLLYQNPAIPQTNAGMARLLAVVEQACQEAVKIGYVAPGQWNGSTILNLETGDYLSTGYLVQSESLESQSQADRDARKAPYIYVALKLAGAIQSVVVQIDVNQ